VTAHVGARVLLVAGVALLALGVALGSRAAQDHLMARRAWLTVSGSVGEADYDPARSDRLYAVAESELDSVALWSRSAGAGGLLLALALVVARGPRRGGSRALAVRASFSAALGGLVWWALFTIAAGASHPWLGPLLSRGLGALAPFAAAGAGLAAFLAVSRRCPASRLASGPERDEGTPP
jgi:hypothetical protein